VPEQQSPSITNPLQVETTAPEQHDLSAYQLSPLHQAQSGLGSWYGPGFHGRRTASGLLFDMHAFTAAHRTLPLLSYVKVTLVETGVHIIAQITDRGPYVRGRIIDLSKGAAAALGLLPKGLAAVIVEPVVPISRPN
jgi:rare lipoprotein A